ncbi:MAG: pyruvate kinase [Dysgonamonadaceae bacterium]|jgi:pyruvate kinase|nr:pyruvate kinase [Dysgonamonadaceae bacterium]
MLKHTKIVATISDKRCDIPFLSSLFEEGMNVVRMNSAHLDKEGFDHIINNVRQVSNRIGILMDTKGPEVRTTISEDSISFLAGETSVIQGDPEGITTKDCICVNYRGFAGEIKLGDMILIDDGELELKVIGKKNDLLTVEVLNDASLGSRKSVNVPGVRINLPSLTEKDIRNIKYAIEMEIDFIAHSFVRSRQDVLDIQRILDEHHSPIKIIAKIENQEGVDNIDEILEVAYGIMVARGDLGIEVPQEKIPGLQRILIRKCVAAKKPVIVATQMLHSMINNPRPTRAEVTDIANAIYYRTDALMLSGETAYGKYPVEAVRTMTRVASEAEKTKLTENDIRVPMPNDDLDVTSFLAKQAVKTSSKLHVKAIVTDSFSGRTARYLAAFRGKSPVFAICYRERTTRELALSYGVWAEYQEEKSNTKEYFLKALGKLLKKGMINRNDMVAYLSGSFGEGGGTSFLEINIAGKILDGSKHFSPPAFK